jgi:hypothetical protein
MAVAVANAAAISGIPTRFGGASFLSIHIVKRKDEVLGLRIGT